MWTIVVLCGIAALIPVAKFAGTMATLYRLRSLRHGDARNVPYARANLGSNSAVIRSAAASGLGRIGARADAAVPEMAALLRSSDNGQRAEAAAVLMMVLLE
jgi:HEAT repeat protein